MRFPRLIPVIFLLWLSGCTDLRSSTSEPALTETAPAASTPASTAEPAVPSTATAVPQGPVTLTLWLPPQFDPQASTPAGEILKSRLEEFSARRPDVRLQVRVKAEEGPGGMLDSLSSASAAAPQALPDLVALPRSLLEAAALKGLLYPYDGLTTALDDADWYAYARQLASLQSSTFGLPFAGDVLVLSYRPEQIAAPPATWQAVLETQSPLLFPASDPQALVALAFYQAVSGQVLDDQGRPLLESDRLVQVLSFFQQAEQAGVMPAWVTEFERDDQVWAALGEARANMAVAWVSESLNNPIPDSKIAPLPTQDGKPFTLAAGWVWALTSREPEHQKLCAQLAEFLTESSFLARWNAAAGSLPPRPSAMAAWKDASLQELVEPIALAAQLYPSTDILAALGPLLEQATTDVLNKEVEPAEAAETAVQGLGSH